MAYPDWVQPFSRVDTKDFVQGTRKGTVTVGLGDWLASLAPGTFVQIGAATGVDNRSPSSDSLIEPSIEAWDQGRYWATRLGLDLRFGVRTRIDVYAPSFFRRNEMLPDPGFVGQVSNATFTRRENAFRHAGYDVLQDERLPVDFVAAVDAVPSQSPAWYCKTDPNGRKVTLYCWILDWRVPGCIAYTRAWLKELEVQFRPDYIHLAAKTGWHMHGSPRLCQPWDGKEPQTGLHKAGGDFCESFYAEGEYEELLRQQIHWCLDQDMALTIQDRPSADGTQASCGIWADERIRAEVVGWQ